MEQKLFVYNKYLKYAEREEKYYIYKIYIKLYIYIYIYIYIYKNKL